MVAIEFTIDWLLQFNTLFSSDFLTFYILIKNIFYFNHKQQYNKLWPLKLTHHPSASLEWVVLPLECNLCSRTQELCVKLPHETFQLSDIVSVWWSQAAVSYCFMDCRKNMDAMSSFSPTVQNMPKYPGLGCSCGPSRNNWGVYGGGRHFGFTIGDLSGCLSLLYSLWSVCTLYSCHFWTPFTSLSSIPPDLCFDPCEGCVCVCFLYKEREFVCGFWSPQLLQLQQIHLPLFHVQHVRHWICG